MNIAAWTFFCLSALAFAMVHLSGLQKTKTLQTMERSRIQTAQSSIDYETETLQRDLDRADRSRELMEKRLAERQAELDELDARLSELQAEDDDGVTMSAQEIRKRHKIIQEIHTLRSSNQQLKTQLQALRDTVK